MIEVVWVDDECLDDSGHLTHLGESICDAAYRRGININAFRDYEAAKAELQRFPYKYMAIILDICDETAIEGNTHDSFLKMGRFLQTHRALYNQQEPYVFNLSGVEKYWADDQMILKEEYTTKKVYEKPDDINLLMQDIINLNNVSKLYSVRVSHENVLNIASQYLDDESNAIFQKCIMLIEGYGVSNDSKLLNDMRKILENLVRCIDLKYPENGLASKCAYIGSKNVKQTDIPQYVKRVFHSLNDITQPSSHNSQQIKDAGQVPISPDIDNGNAPYVLRSCLLEICNIINWLPQSRFKVS